MNFTLYVFRQSQDLLCLSPQHHSDQGPKVYSVPPYLSLSLPGKTATLPQNRTSFPDTLQGNSQLLIHLLTHFVISFR